MISIFSFFFLSIFFLFSLTFVIITIIIIIIIIIDIDKKQQRYIIKKMINIAIRVTYYIFCCRNRNWNSPGLMQF